MPLYNFTFIGLVLLAWGSTLHAQASSGKARPLDKFRQATDLWPTPNEQRTASGAPGRGYWQQRADYEIDARLDEAEHTLTGRETITYYNQSPDTLSYLWVQIDPNFFGSQAHSRLATAAPDFKTLRFDRLGKLLYEDTFSSDLQITAVTDATGSSVPHTLLGTLMRVDLAVPLASGQRFRFSLAWNYRLNVAQDEKARRTGYEILDDGNAIYTIGQWYPRMAAYTDSGGWQVKQDLGAGDFSLEFGNFLVRITVPLDHVVAATGVLQNPAVTLSAGQRERLRSAQRSATPQFIITPTEAKQSRRTKVKGNKTWVFAAENVRDFAFASSRAFVWDAMGVDLGASKDSKPVMAMSFYPNEAEPLWSKYSTHALSHTLETHSRHAARFPYPVAINVSGGVSGMEYPMICFNANRPEKDGTYTQETQYGLISVIIHEMGHSWIPMMVNTDERQWDWMDEGLSDFLEYLAEEEWQENYPTPSYSADREGVIAYMMGANQRSIMTGADAQSGSWQSTFSKPAVALDILRETVLGRQAFDFALQTFVRRWSFKRANPEDFFRTMEDASGVDLDWFWRGWFYTTDHVDIAIENVRRYTLDTRDPDIEAARAAKERQARPALLARQRNAALPKRVDRYPELKGEQSPADELTARPGDRQAYEKLLVELREQNIDPALLKTERNFYAVELRNAGGLVMPLIFRIEYGDGSVEEVRTPAEIWRTNSEKVSKLFITNKTIKAIQLDPHEETADADIENNFWPRRIVQERFELHH